MDDDFRKRRGLVTGPCDIVVHAKPEIARKPLALLESEFVDCIARFLRNEGRSKDGR